jgi:glyoxylase-like metal-dependent hydrolase (beta-lactamase superfamily II)
MRFFSYYSVINFSNCYLLGREGSNDALLIDPGIFDEGLLKLIEDNSFYVRHVLITHSHHAHVSGIRTLRKIYDATLWGFEPKSVEFPVQKVAGSETIELAGFSIEVLETPGHSNDSVCYRIDRLLFTGDTLSAGTVGETDSPYERALLLASIRGRIIPLDDGTLVFPGHGPPTTIELERRFNPDLQEESPKTP